MSALLKIDQAGLAAGVAGKARTDGLRTGAVVTLTNTFAGTCTTRFRLLWVPPGDTTAVGSLAVSGNPKVWTFTPTANKPGTYRIELIQDEGLPTEIRERRVLRVRTANRGLAIIALNETGDPNSSLVNSATPQIEAAEDNSDDWSAANLNSLRYAAWWRVLHELILQVDSLPTSFGSNSITNQSTVPGATLSDALNTLAVPVGLVQLRKEIYYANGNRELYDGNNNLVSTTASSTWSRQADGTSYRVIAVGSGGSGASGSVVASGSAGGGSGGGGACCQDRMFDRNMIGPTQSVVVGAGVAGGAAVSTTTAAGGNNGNPGNITALGTLVTAYGGGAGFGPPSNAACSGGGGGGNMSTGGVGQNTGASLGGRPGVSGAFGSGAAGAGGSSGAAGNGAEFGGGSGAGSNGAAQPGLAGGSSARGAGGGGSGASTNVNTKLAGGAGGSSGSRTDGATSGNGGTAGTSAPTAGGPGANGDGINSCGAGGGGGGSNAGGSVTAGDGGKGGFPGGGGGGGGGTNRSSAGTAVSGKGGDSGDGVLIVITYA